MKLGIRSVSAAVVLVLAGWGSAWGNSVLVSPTPVSVATPIPIPVPSAKPSSVVPVPSPSVTAAANPLPAPEPALTDKEVTTLRRNFLRAQASELRALNHRHQSELAQLKSSQAAYVREWNAKEADQRREFTSRKPTAVDRARYGTDLQLRRQAMLAIQKDEFERRQREQAARVSAVKEEQSMKRADFEAALKKRERPSHDLWPPAGR
jgi:hypothetical protein